LLLLALLQAGLAALDKNEQHYEEQNTSEYSNDRNVIHVASCRLLAVAVRALAEYFV